MQLWKLGENVSGEIGEAGRGGDAIAEESKLVEPAGHERRERICRGTAKAMPELWIKIKAREIHGQPSRPGGQPGAE